MRTAIIGFYWLLAICLYGASLLSLVSTWSGIKGANAMAGLLIALGVLFSWTPWPARAIRGRSVWTDSDRRRMSIVGWGVLVVTLAIFLGYFTISDGVRSPASLVEAFFGLVFFWIGKESIGRQG